MQLEDVLTQLMSTIASTKTNAEMFETEMSDKLDDLVRKSDILLEQLEEARTDSMMSILSVKRMLKDSVKCQNHVDQILLEHIEEKQIEIK